MNQPKAKSAFEEKYDKKLSALFEKHQINPGLVKDLCQRGYVSADVEQKDVLFVGINPSYTKEAKEESYFYNVKGAVEGYPKHYARFDQYAKECNKQEHYSYMDLFYFRETDQKFIKQVINAPNGVNFLVDQLCLSMDILEEIQPKIIIVCNKEASHFTGINRTDENGKSENVWMGYEFEFNQNFGIDVITGLHPDTIHKSLKTTKLIGTPVIFTSTLTYKPKLDMRRLVWQTTQVLKYYDGFFGSENYAKTAQNRFEESVNPIIERLVSARTKKHDALNNKFFEHGAQQRDIEKEEMDKLYKLLYLFRTSGE